MLTIGDRFPAFDLQAVVSRDPADAFIRVSDTSFPGKWKCVFFWPMDFTFVCPTEVKAFGDRDAQFAERDCQVLGASIDSEYVHLAWRQHHPDLHEIPYPMLADVKRELSEALGILHPDAGVAMRATFLVDPEGTIRYVDVTDMSVGRSPEEVLRVLDALQTDELCPCDWKPGEATLGAA
jgi:alkyl hydroperoxide reductase subunit AhpC